jgi:acyl-coenzyme A thioesterase PaaI-like protein
MTDSTVGRAPFSTIAEFLGGPEQRADAEWIFEFGPHLDSTWGGTYGGALGAGVLQVARAASPGRSPRSVHLQMMRPVGLGGARATSAIVNEGRTVTAVEVRLFEQRGKLAVLGLVTMIDPAALKRDLNYTSVEPFEIERQPLASNAYATTPIVETLQLPTTMERWRVANVVRSVTGTMSNASAATTPWQERAATGPELSCVIGDLCNGQGISSALPPDLQLAFPNYDLSMRFTAEDAPEQALGVGTLLAVHDGTALVEIRIQAEAQLLARGLSGSVLIPLAPVQAPVARWQVAEQQT